MNHINVLTRVLPDDLFSDDAEDSQLFENETKVDERSEPADRFNIVYILFYLFGITSLMPWNFIITANDYWMYKFRDVTNNGSTTTGKSEFQAAFTSYLNVATAVPNLVFLLVNTLFGHLVASSCKMIGSLFMIVIPFVITTIFVEVDTDGWQNEFFIITLLLLVLMTGSSAIFTGSLYGIAGKFSPKYMAAVVSGQALGGIVAAVAQILSLAFRISPQSSALIYFLIADVLAFFALVTYIWLQKFNFFTHHMFKDSLSVTAAIRLSNVSVIHVVKKIWLNSFNIFAIFAVTMSVYPALTVLVEPHPTTSDTEWNRIFFVPVVNYLFFNCGDYAGRLSAGFLMMPESDWIITVASLLRLIGIPLLMMCNAQPRHHLAVWFPYDYQYIFIMVLFALSNGYLTNITFMNSVRKVENEERDKASSVTATMLAVGLSTGASLGVFLIRLL